MDLKGKRGLAALVAASSMIVLGAAGAATNTTFIYAGAADPTYLDPALVSDGESFRIARQIFDTLVQLAPGTTKLQPALAKSWRPSRDGKTWTFNLRTGVKFHDGTPFNSAAVCANFNRWYNWTGPFQDASASYYYRQLFGGFKKNESTGLGPPLYKSCRGAGRYVVKITLNRRSGPFVPSLVLPAFAMQSPTAMRVRGEQGRARLRHVPTDGQLCVQPSHGHGAVEVRLLDDRAARRARPKQRVLG